MQSEGIIKFTQDHIISKLPRSTDEAYLKLTPLRTELHQLKLININQEGFGYGNISYHLDCNTFLITASQTGNIPRLTKQHYTLVTSTSISSNHLSSIGQLPASSESLTHAAIYKHHPQTSVIIHIHNMQIWEQEMLLQRHPITSTSAEYGTVDIAIAAAQAAKNDQGIIILGGHPEGIIYYAQDIDSIRQLYLKHYRELCTANADNIC